MEATTTRDDQVTAVAAHLRLAVTRTARRMRQEAGTGLSPSQVSALATIERHGPLSPSELADIERIKRPTATRLIGRLEELRVLARDADPDDARRSLLAVTPSGSDLLRKLRRRKTAYLAQRLKGLDADELETLDQAARILERMLERERA
jgi:DNA-binding MarR family transcriptional regulator